MYSEDNKANEISYESALSKVQYICSRQEKCCSDIRKKLEGWQISYDDQDTIIQSLIDDKFIDEKRYSGFYVRDKYRFNKWGRIKIKYALKVKKIPSHDINTALKEIDDNEYKENLISIVKNKLKSTKEDDPYKLKSKVFNNATSKGFESNLILEILNNLDIFKN